LLWRREISSSASRPHPSPPSSPSGSIRFLVFTPRILSDLMLFYVKSNLVFGSVDLISDLCNAGKNCEGFHESYVGSVEGDT
jgi:hypothetical protein